MPVSIGDILRLAIPMIVKTVVRAALNLRRLQASLMPEAKPEMRAL